MYWFEDVTKNVPPKCYTFNDFISNNKCFELSNFKI